MIEHEIKDGIFIVTLNRPDVRNAVDKQTAEDLATVFRAFEQNEDAKVAVLCGANDHFCAGADLKAISEGAPNRFELFGDAPMGVSRMHLSKPVIAAISGYAVAGGLELALWCDLRVAEKDAIMGVFCRKWGVPLIDGGTVRLPRLIGFGRAMDLILTGRAVHSDEALAMGLVNRVVENGTSKSAAIELAKKIASFPQVCVNTDRESMYAQIGQTEVEALKSEYRFGEMAFSDVRQGAKNFLDRK